MVDENNFSFEGFSRVNIETGMLTPLDRSGNPIEEHEDNQGETNN